MSEAVLVSSSNLESGRSTQQLMTVQGQATAKSNYWYVAYGNVKPCFGFSSSLASSYCMFDSSDSTVSLKKGTSSITVITSFLIHRPEGNKAVRESKEAGRRTTKALVSVTSSHAIRYFHNSIHQTKTKIFSK